MGKLGQLLKFAGLWLGIFLVAAGMFRSCATGDGSRTDKGVPGNTATRRTETLWAAEAAQPSEPQGISAGEVRTSCKAAVRAKLVAPDEAEIDGPMVNTEPGESGQIVWRGTVQGKNAYGVKMSAKFLCGFDVARRAARAYLIEN